MDWYQSFICWLATINPQKSLWIIGLLRFLTVDVFPMIQEWDSTALYSERGSAVLNGISKPQGFPLGSKGRK